MPGRSSINSEIGPNSSRNRTITLWALKWLDMRIPREHRAQRVIKADPASFSPSHLADLLAPSGYKAQFRRQTQSEDGTHVRLWFEICWKQPEVAKPPLDLPKLVNEHYPILSFMITSETRN